MGRSVLTFQYLTGFACIGADCEDNCCTGGHPPIPVDEDRYDALEAALPPMQFEHGVERCAQGPHHALLRTNDDGSCRFLQARLCNIHKHLGEQLQPDACAVFPRHLLEVDGQLELTGNPACPEAARRLLLTDDATAFVQMDARDAGRLVRAEVIDTTRSSYASHVNDIRQLMLDLLAMKTHSVEHRLVLMTWFANATADVFHQDGTGDVFAHIQKLASPLRAPQFRVKLIGAAEESPVPPALMRSLFERLRRHALSLMDRSAYGDLVTEVLGSYAAEHGEAPDVWQAYLERRARVIQRFAPQIDRFFTNFAANYWMRHPYLASRNLFAHMQQLLVQIAVQRFLLFSLRSARDTPESLDRAAVRVFYTAARAFERSALPKQLAAELANMSLNNEKGAMYLARL